MIPTYTYIRPYNCTSSYFTELIFPGTNLCQTQVNSLHTLAQISTNTFGNVFDSLLLYRQHQNIIVIFSRSHIVITNTHNSFFMPQLKRCMWNTLRYLETMRSHAEHRPETDLGK